MEIPKYNEFFLPILELLEKSGTMQRQAFLKPLKDALGLTEEQVNQMYPSGNGHIYYDRVSWALSYLKISGLISKPKRGIYEISDEGKQMLKSPDKIQQYIKGKVSKSNNKKSSPKPLTASTSESASVTPNEILFEAFESIKKTVYDDIISTILSKTSYAFEKLVVQLLQAMGYGSFSKNAGEVTQRTNDGGIDGVIKEDVLGLGQIYVQAKRYKSNNTIGREALQNFVGALAVAQSSKGVFITTSSFTKPAIEYVNSLNGNTNIVLIDGHKLAEYLYHYGLGMQVEEQIEIKKLDADFWDEMEDDS